MSKRNSLSGVVVLCLVLTSGCGLGIQPQHFPATKNRSWIVKYSFPITIQSEPTGARVYIQDRYLGDTPLSTTLKVDDLSVNQKGYITMLCLWDLWGNCKCQPESALEWKDISATFSGGWVIKIFKDGYQPFEFNLQCDSLKQLNNVVAPLTGFSGDRLPADELSSVESEHFLFALKSTVVVYQSQPQYQQSTITGNDISAEYNAAKVEYESALQAYNAAKSKVDEARFMNSMPRGSGNPLLDLGVGALSSGEVQMQERNLEMAKERLDRARERLRILEIKK